MKTHDNIITPRERLHIAAQIQAGICANDLGGWTNDAAIVLTDNLIEATGCIVAGAPEVPHEMD